MCAKQQSALANPLQRRRPIWQRLLRLGALVLLLTLTAGVLLPWWLPTEPIRARLQASLRTQLDLPVEIETVNLSWAEGVKILGLRVPSPLGFEGDLLDVEEIHCPFSPLDLAIGHVDWMELHSPRLTVRIDEEGNLNTQPLRRLEGGLRARRISIRDASVVLHLPEDPPLRLRISNVQFNDGQLSHLGEVSMSAWLDQDGGGAPMSLLLSGSTGEQGEETEAQLHFTNLDLAQLPLPQGEGFPIRAMQGRTDGQILVAITPSGEIEQFTVELLTRDLNLTSTVPVELSTIDQAGLRLTASFDTISQKLDLYRLHLRLPGLDVTGQASLYLDALAGQWEGLDAFRLEGTIRPEQAVALLTGKKMLVEGFYVSGPVSFVSQARREQTDLAMRLDIDATESVFTQAGRFLKPAGRTATLRLQGDLLRRDRVSLDLRDCRAALGRNELECRATLHDLPAWTADWWSAISTGESGTERELPALDFRGLLRLRDLTPFHDLAPAVPWGQIALRGEADVLWSLETQPACKANVSLRLPRESSLHITDWLAKPTDRALTVDLRTQIDPSTRVMQDISADLTSGFARLSFEQARLEPAAQGLDVHGAMEVVRIEELLPLCPAAGALLPKDLQLRGTLTGRCGATVQPEDVAAEFSLDLRQLGLAANEFWNKPVGEATTAEGRIRLVGEDTQLDVSLDGPPGTLNAGISSNRSSAGREERLFLEAEANRIEQFVSHCPLLRKALGRNRLAGAGRLRLELGRTPEAIPFAVEIDAPRLRIDNDDPALPVHVDHTLRSRIAGVYQPPARRLDLHTLLLESEDLSLAVKGFTATLNKDPAPALHSCRGEIHCRGDLGKLSRNVFPIAKSLAAQQELVGRFALGGEFTFNDDGLDLRGSLDLGEMGFSAGPVAKPVGMPASVFLRATTPRDLASLQIRNCSVRLGSARLEADAIGPIITDPDTQWPHYRPEQAHVAVSVKDLEFLETLVPALQPRKPRGGGFLELQWRGRIQDESTTLGGEITSATFRAADLRFEHLGRMVRAEGTILMDRTVVAPGRTPRMGRIRTDNLDLQVDKNHAILLADIVPDPQAPSGTFHLLVEYLDDKELADWLAGGPSNPPEEPLDEEETYALRLQARQSIAWLRTHLLHADLKGRLSAEAMRLFDPTVREHYRLNRMEMELSASDGVLGLQYEAGVSGGMTRGQLRTDLSEQHPVLHQYTQFEEVVATDPIRPQISRFFPGNTVNGLFSREETVQIALADYIANNRDKRYKLLWEGQAKMVATDGDVLGRAAPKFVTKVFPGLNLTKYHYDTMTGFSRFRADGIAENETIFSGAYDVYMEGTTDPDNTIRYTVGLVLLGGGYADWQRNWKQGRFPILKVQGRIEDGKLVDDTVAYPWPNETLFEIFLKNNIVYRAWKNLRKDAPTDATPFAQE